MFTSAIFAEINWSGKFSKFTEVTPFHINYLPKTDEKYAFFFYLFFFFWHRYIHFFIFSLLYKFNTSVLFGFKVVTSFLLWSLTTKLDIKKRTIGFSAIFGKWVKCVTQNLACVLPVAKTVVRRCALYRKNNEKRAGRLKFPQYYKL